MMESGTNPNSVRIIRTLRKRANETGAALWDDIADRLSRPRSRREGVNLSRINAYTEEGETIIVPGKVLGAGALDHAVQIAAFKFSKQAEEKITKAKGECLTILQLTERNPKGSNVKVIG